MKIQKQEESMENTRLKIKVKMGFVEKLNQLKVELVSLQGISPRAGKSLVHHSNRPSNVEEWPEMA